MVLEVDLHLVRALKKCAYWLALLTIVLGGAVLVGWHFDIELLKRPIKGLVAMNPATAVCFILCGFSLFFLSGGFAGGYLKVAKVLAWLVIIICTVKIVALLFGFGAVVDSLLYPDKIKNEVISNISNRMAPNTAACFILSGASVLLIAKEKRDGVTSQLVSLSILMLSLVSIIGYVFKVPEFYGVLAYIPMAIHTALGFFLFSLALFAFDANTGFMRVIIGNLPGSFAIRALLPVAILLPILLGALRLYGEKIGLYSSSFGLMLYVIVTIVGSLYVIWRVGIVVNKAHWERMEVELKLKDALNQLRVSNKELESFSYSVSHDLRAPLRAINGFTDMFLQAYGESLNNEGKRLMEVVKKNAVNMGQLIDDLLDFSRIGRKEMKTERVNLEVLVVDSINEVLQAELDLKNNIHVKKLGSVTCDRQMMKRVFTNLISNAVKYSRKEGKPNIEIGIFNGDDGGKVYYVKDNGVGFDMQYAGGLFNVFHRLHSPKEFEGTGVGLALVKRVIDKHGGDVWAEAQVNVGATFFFTIPDEGKPYINKKRA